jgi:uncharacterized repeat protein (TIGR01451 family)/fimbrial isopeptide formation D2 family protein
MRQRHIPRHADSRRPRLGRPRRWTAVSVVSYLVLGTLSAAFVTSTSANAATTPVSTFTKTGTNQRTGSMADSATGSQGTAQPGDTIKWALNYKNSTGADATVSMTDPIPNGQSYVAGSLQTPPNLTGSVSGSTVSANGTVLSGATASQSPNFSAAAVNFNSPGGDGYSVEGFGNSIYTVFHHSALSTTVFCATLANQICPGWPAFSTYVSPTAGIKLGTGPVSTFASNYVNGSFIEGGRLYWTVEQNGTPDVFGTQCLDLTTLLSCGYNQLGTTTVPGYAMSGDGIAAADGNYYYLDNNGAMQCVTPTGTSCGAVDVTGVPVSDGGIMEVGTYGRYVYASYDAPPTKTNYLTCFDTTTHAKCPNFPKATGTFDGAFDSEVMPVVSAAGAFLGACAIVNAVCFDTSGNAIPNPWSQTRYSFNPAGNQGFGTGVLVGTKYYTGHAEVVDCYDFAQNLVGGKVQLCSAFTTHPPDSQSYTVRPLANLPGCMASNGNAAKISVFNAATGAPCASASQTLKLDPTVYYCDGQPGHIDSWGAVTLPGLSASDYAGATLTLFGADGAALPAWTNVPFPATGPQSIDISSIPVTGNTATLTAQVNLAAVNNTAAVNASRVRATWIGEPIQVCYETTVNPVACLTTVPISNTANVVTIAGAISDAPTGNSSGTAIINVTPSSAQCMLHLAKTASPDTAKPGTTVTYTVNVQNTGTMDYLAADPAQFSDDITDVLADSVYNTASLTASAGTASYNPATNVISWSGPLAASATATITYTVTVNDPDAGDHSMFNRVATPPGTPSNCAANSTDPACDVTVPISDLHVTKSANPASGSTLHAGQVVTYTLTFQNTGLGVAAVDYTDDLSKVLDDATVTSAPAASNGNLTASAVSSNQFTVTGAVPGKTTYTVTYQVTVNADGARGDNNLLNFVFPTNTTPPTTCVAGDPLCTEHHVFELVVAKTSDPADGSSVHAGDVISYTLTFQNIGTGPAPVDHTDFLAKVLDDGTVTSGPTASNANLSATTVANDQFTVVGTVPAGATYTVTYQVTVKPYAQQGDHQLDNFVEPSGTPPPAACDPNDPLCVHHPVQHLSVVKTASTTDRPAPGATVTYTVVVTNDGTVDYTGQSPATMTDDLSGVLDDATYNGDVIAVPGTGTATVTGTQLAWSGPLAAGDSVTITYSVTYTGNGDTIMTNTACVPKQGTDPNCDTVQVPAANLHISKSVNPANFSTVTAGQVLTYTLTFQNTGQGAGDVSYTDFLGGVLDDAALSSGPTASNGALTVGAVANQQFGITGTVPPTTTYTVTYQVTVKPDGQRGDNQLDNFLEPTGTTPPATCQQNDPACTHNPVPEITPSKSVDPASGTTVHAGDVLTYTLTFANVGKATGSIDYVDYLGDVLDDAAITTAPTASNSDLTASGIANNQFEVTGTVPAGSTYTVTYQVTIKPDGQRGNDAANNFVAKKGDTPPSQCAPSDRLCTTNPMPDLQSWKTVNPVSGTTVVPGQTLTYTLHFTNHGTAPGAVDNVDDITQAVDDATVASQPASSDPALTVTAFGSDNRSAITGSLAPGQTVAVTYQLKVNDPDAGDNILANFVQKPSDPAPTSPDCTPTDPQHPQCTSNPVGLLQVTKSVNPQNFSDVHAGDVLSYTLTFHNVGKGAAKVDYTDDLAGVLDDGDLVSSPSASGSALTASAVTNGSFRVTGTLPAGQTVTVTYQVKVKPYDDQRDHVLGNFLDPTGTPHATTCVPDNPLCTQNPVPAPAGGGSGGGGGSLAGGSGSGGGGLAVTGGDWRTDLILGGLLLGAGALLMHAGRRRKAI